MFLCGLNDEKLHKGDAFYGHVRFSKSGRIYLANYKKVEAAPMRRNGKNEAKAQAFNLRWIDVDAFLVKCKRSMYDKGLRAGTPEWDRGKQMKQATLYSVLTVQSFMFLEMPQWYKSTKKERLNN